MNTMNKPEFNDNFQTCENPKCFNALLDEEQIEAGTCSEDCSVALEEIEDSGSDLTASDFPTNDAFTEYAVTVRRAVAEEYAECIKARCDDIHYCSQAGPPLGFAMEPF